MGVGVGVLVRVDALVGLLVAAALSNIVSNVPAVLLLKPLLASFDEPQRAWLVLAMASTLAGNLTILGSGAGRDRISRVLQGWGSGDPGDFAHRLADARVVLDVASS